MQLDALYVFSNDEIKKAGNENKSQKAVFDMVDQPAASGKDMSSQAPVVGSSGFWNAQKVLSQARHASPTVLVSFHSSLPKSLFTLPFSFRPPLLLSPNLLV